MADNTNAKIYERDFAPQRELLLWGWDNENNPSLIVFYGQHQFERAHQLKDTVDYTSYMIFRGQQGHFPSFEAVKILTRYNYQTRKTSTDMYYKKDIKGTGYYCYGDEKDKVEEFTSLKKGKHITIPYFEKWEYEQYVDSITKQRLKFPNFRFAEHPSQIFDLSEELTPYYDTIYTIFSSPNIYIRKKYLKQLLASNPPEGLWEYLLSRGSSELISGLFLEMAAQKNPALLPWAKKLKTKEITWVSKSYAKGVERCIAIYINSLDESLRNDRIQWIRETLSDMDLYYLNKDGTIDITEGKHYYKYAAEGYLSEFRGYYDNNWNYKYERKANHYKISAYCDGLVLDIIQLKNTIQEAQSYDLADVIGKIAYYLDAPRLSFYLKGGKKGKTLKYFRRYLRRILDGYARNDEEKFIEAMKVLFSSYTNKDYLCKTPGNFEFNYFIKHYLYHTLYPEETSNWYQNYQWSLENQIHKVQGRYEFMPQVWERHLDAIIDIVSVSEVEVILKAFYFILKDSLDTATGLSYDQLFQLSNSAYEPLADMFREQLAEKLKQETVFDSEMMFRFFSYTNERMHTMAMEYFKRTNGKLQLDDMIAFLFQEHFEQWQDFFVQLLNQLDEQETCRFINMLFESNDRIEKEELVFTDETKDAILGLSKKVQSHTNKRQLFDNVLSKINAKGAYTDLLMDLAEKTLFAMSYEDLQSALKQTAIQQDVSHSARVQLLLSVLMAVKNETIPSDSHILEILQNGTPDGIRTLIQLIRIHATQLQKRFSTIIIMLEADLESMNQIAKQVFTSLPTEEQKKLHSIILDSPEQKVFEYALQKLYEIYESKEACIPEDLLVQMLEHSSNQVKAYVSAKITEIINCLGNGNEELFMYYTKTLLYLPNKVSKAKENIYNVLPVFVSTYGQNRDAIEKMLFDIGGSNIRLDSERALCTLAKIKKEVETFEG